MTYKELKRFIKRLRYYTVGRDECVEASNLIEKAYTGPRFIHNKRGTTYTVVGSARLQYSGVAPKDGDMLTLYLSDDGVYSVRAPEEFNDGRFTAIGTAEDEFTGVTG